MRCIYIEKAFPAYRSVFESPSTLYDCKAVKNAYKPSKDDLKKYCLSSAFLNCPRFIAVRGLTLKTKDIPGKRRV